MGLYEGIKDVAKVVQQADNIELYRQLVDLSAQALEMQNEINRLTAENTELRKKQDLEAAIVRHNGLYVTIESNDEIFYCSHCWDSERKLIQMFTENGKYRCPHCNIEGVSDQQAYREYMDRQRARYQVTRKNIW
ncbi:MAG: hypothetical protein E7081_00555 [Bacteroidales bacterium]|nr:hypothetical protein [Bacteroidales bacterium]